MYFGVHLLTGVYTSLQINTCGFFNVLSSQRDLK